jgi:UDP-glucoronosyl and UDP-glucosyl transferase
MSSNAQNLIPPKTISTDADAPFLNDLMLGEPTTEYQSIWTRFLNRYIIEHVIQSIASSVLNENTPVRKELGLKSAKHIFSRKMDDSIKLINNFFGLEPARPLGPLVRFIGPIMPSSYPSLDDATAEFLESHQKVAYVSFGHHASPALMDIIKVLIALFDSVESGVIDGFIWAGVSLPAFPDQIVSSSGIVHNVTDMIQNGANYKHYRFTKWAAQFAILMHPSTAMFLTHGGANSIFESLYSGTKMLVHPFFTDQPQNARVLELSGAALTYNRKTVKATEIADLLRRVVEDDDNRFQKNMNRLSAIVQLRAADAIRNGAAVVEEVLFSSDEDDLPHLYVASRNMNYLKANNIDIALLLIAIVGGIIASLYMVVKQLITYLIACSNTKMKLE